MTAARLSHDGRTLTVRVPMAFAKRGGRKLVISPDGAPSWAPARRRVDSAMIKALARAFRWRKLMETGAYGTVEEIAAAEKINASYVSRVLRLTLLAPDIVEAILDGRQPAEMTLAVLMKPFLVEWQEQTEAFFSAILSPGFPPDPQLPPCSDCRSRHFGRHWTPSGGTGCELSAPRAPTTASAG